MKKYCLLENGDIQDCYYDKNLNEPRNIYKEGRYFYLDHDVFGNGCIVMFHHRILRFADTKKELKEWWKGKKK